MATNQKDHPNQHSLYLAATGYGKTTALMTNSNLAKKPDRLIIWDPGQQYGPMVDRVVSTLREAYAVMLEQVNKNGKISLSLSMPKAKPQAFEAFCAMVWQVLDGNKPTIFIVEEVAGVQVSNGRAGDEWGVLIREGRKFGLRILATTQRSQEMDKTLFTQVQYKFIGCHDIRDAQLIAPQIGVTGDAIFNQKIGEFYCKELGPKPAYKVKIPAPKKKKSA